MKVLLDIRNNSDFLVLVFTGYIFEISSSRALLNLPLWFSLDFAFLPFKNQQVIQRISTVGRGEKAKIRLTFNFLLK